MPEHRLDPWAQAQGRLRESLDEHSYKNWFSQTRYESYEDGCLTVSVPSQFFADWLRDHYLDTIHESMRAVAPEYRDVQFIPLDEAPMTPAANAAVRIASAESKGAARPKPATRNTFDARSNFSSFVVGAGNRFAYAAAKAVAESPARAYNPLFLYGATGLGKTHLMQAIGQEILERVPGSKVVFISSERFTNQLIESIAKKSTQQFRSKYRKVDVLLIDDIHFIAGKEATQEEFFHTFNELFEQRKQIVLSSDRGPKDIHGLEERLVSRFEWGLVTDIQAPDLETRVAILQNKAAEEGFTILPEVNRYIATRVITNIRVLQGALTTVLAYSRLTHQPITLSLAEEVMTMLVGTEDIKQIHVQDIQRAVAERFDVRIADLRGRSRQRQVSYPRQIAMYLCKELIPGMSLNEIGEAFGGKDHTTVIYACQKITEEAKNNKATQQALANLEKAIRS